MEKQKDKKLTRKLWLQAGGLMLSSVSFWFLFAVIFGFAAIFSVFDCILSSSDWVYYFEINDIIWKELLALFPQFVIIIIVLFLLFFFKPDLGSYYIPHMVLGIVTQGAVVYYWILHFVLPLFFYDFYYNSILPFFFENYWVIVAFGVSAQLILMVLFHVKKPLVFAIYLLTNASIHLYILYIAEKIVIYSLI